MATEAVMAAQMASQTSKLLRREEVAEGTIAFHFERPSGFKFKAGQFADVTLIETPETDAEGNTRTFSIASPPFENELVFTTQMRDTAFKHSLRKTRTRTRRCQFTPEISQSCPTEVGARQDRDSSPSAAKIENRKHRAVMIMSILAC
jgi:hypothetical protein